MKVAEDDGMDEDAYGPRLPAARIPAPIAASLTIKEQAADDEWVEASKLSKKSKKEDKKAKKKKKEKKKKSKKDRKRRHSSSSSDDDDDVDDAKILKKIVQLKKQHKL